MSGAFRQTRKGLSSVFLTMLLVACSPPGIADQSSTTAPGMPTSTTVTISTPTTSPVVHPFPVGDIEVGGIPLAVWIADTPDNRQQGLMEIESLPEGIDGMLFVFEEPGSRSFWMLNTLMPLDIWWFSPEATMLGSTFMEPCESQPCPDYPSPGRVLWALETPAGRFDFEVGSLLNAGIPGS